MEGLPKKRDFIIELRVNGLDHRRCTQLARYLNSISRGFAKENEDGALSWDTDIEIPSARGRRVRIISLHPEADYCNLRLEFHKELARDDYIPPIRGRYLYHAVVAFERHCQSLKFPIDVFMHWVRMLKLAGNDELNCSDVCYEDYRNHVEAVADWIESQADRFEKEN